MSNPIASINPFDALYVDDVRETKAAVRPSGPKAVKSEQAVPKAQSTLKSAPSVQRNGTQKRSDPASRVASGKAGASASIPESGNGQVDASTADGNGNFPNSKPSVRSAGHRHKQPSANRDRQSRTGISESKVKYTSGRQGWKNVIENSIESPVIDEASVAVEGEQVEEAEEQKPTFKSYQEFLDEQKNAKPKSSTPLSPTTRKLNEGVDGSILSADMVSFSRNEDKFIDTESFKPGSQAHPDKKEPKKNILNLKELSRDLPRERGARTSSTGRPNSKPSSNNDRRSNRQEQSKNVNIADSASFPSL